MMNRINLSNDMKHNFLSYALMLVAALSCTPVELTQKQEGERETDVDGKTVIGAEICEDMARTTMGTLSGNVYPIYWSTGDVIDINGVVSTGITISEKDRKHATFAFSAPFTDNTLYAVYPASRVVPNSNAGSASVLLPSIQTYASNNFDASTALMVGKAAADVTNVPFSNVMAYLQIIPGGSATNISRVTVTARGGEKMCGLFNVDFTNKKLVAPSPDPEAGLISTRTASVVCDSPVSADTPLIVAIPAQTYSQGIMVIIQDTEGHITQKSNKTANLIFEAGKIYLMDGITFEASAKNASSMTIDGQFNDWLLAPSVSYSLPEGAQYSDVRELKLAADDHYVYMYMELFEPDNIGGNGCRAMDIYIDADADPSTGANLGKLDGIDYFNNAGGLEWYLEPGNVRASGTTEYSTLQGTGMYKWCGPSGFPALGQGYLKSQNGNYNDSHIYGEGNFSLASADGNGKIGRYEVKLSRKYLGIFGCKAYFGVKYMLPEQVAGQGWPISGLLPQGKFNGVSRAVTDMAALALASTAYPTNHITIDGNYDDWDNIEGWTSECTVASNAKYLGVNSMKVTADGDFVYIYFDFAHDDRNGDASSCAFDFFIDADADVSTGFYLNGPDSKKLFSPCGVEWYIETNTHFKVNYHNFATIGYFLENKGPSGVVYAGANCINHDSEVNKDVSLAKLVANGDGALMEWKIARSILKLTNTSASTASFGVKYMCPGWTVDGICPQDKQDASGNFVPAPMLKVTLPPKN